MHEQEIEIVDTAFRCFRSLVSVRYVCARARHALTKYVSKIHKIYESRHSDKAVKPNEKNQNSFKTRKNRHFSWSA